MLRDSKPRFERFSPAMRVLAVGTVLVGGLLVAGLRGPTGDRPSVAQAAESPAAEALAGAADEIDLKHVPRDAAAFVAIRPAALFARPELNDLRKLFNEPGAPGGEYTLPLEEIRQVTYVFPKLPEGRPFGPMDVVTMLQAKKPYDFKKFTDREVPRAVAREFAGVTYYASPKQTRGKAPIVLSMEPCYFRPDDRTLVCTKSEQALRDFIAARPGGPPASLGAAAWKGFQADHAVVVVNPASLAATLENSPRTSQPPVFSALAPLWEDTTALAVGLRADDRLRLHATAIAKTPELAEKLQQTLESVRVLAGNMSKQFRVDAEKNQQPGAAFIRATFDVVDKLIDQLRFQREGSVVTAQTSVDMESLRRGPLGSLFLVARTDARRTHLTSNLRQIALAMHNYHDRYKQLPPAVLYGPDGETPYSWRVALLPYLDQNELYKQYRFDEPWDGPNNRQLLAKMPPVYGSPKEPDKTRAAYFALVGPGTVFEGSKGRSVDDVVDGTSNTLMIVEAKRNVPWTKPEDVPYDPKQPLPKLGGYFDDKDFLAAFCDGSVHVVAHTVNEEVLRSLIERNDGRPTPPELRRPPR